MRLSFGMLKPDCIERKLEREIFERIESVGLKIYKQKYVFLSQYQIDIIYDSIRRHSYYEDMSHFLLSGRCDVFIVKGEEAIVNLNKIVGFKDPRLAKPKTIRRDFGESIRRNVIHSTKNISTFKKEVDLSLTPLFVKTLRYV